MVENQARFQAEVQQELASTPFSASALKPLTGGTANFIFKATLESPLTDGTTEVAVKHGQGFVALHPGFAIPTSRCKVEEECLEHLAKLGQLTTATSSITTPKLLYFNPETNTQIQEYLTDAINLKEYALKHWQGPTSNAAKQRCIELGKGLGQWLRSFHDWADHEYQKDLRGVVSGNKAMQSLKHTINYRQALAMVDKYPAILGDSGDLFNEIADAAHAELQDEANLKVIHGDFWTGNILLPDTQIQDEGPTPVRVIDWEMAQLGVRPLDLGQMIAELWQLKLYKHIDAGVWLIDGFTDGYSMSPEDAFRAIIHVGIHLICFGSQTPGWGTEKQAEDLVRTGKEVIVKAWKKDVNEFESHQLRCLFK